MKSYQKILNRYYHKGYFTDPELADLLDCSSKRIHNVRSGKNDLWAWELVILQDYFSKQNRHDLNDISFPENYRMYQLKEMRIDGSWHDETRAILREIVQADESADKSKYEEALKRLNHTATIGSDGSRNKKRKRISNERVQLFKTTIQANHRRRNRIVFEFSGGWSAGKAFI